jgi:uncharacterized membrane protein
VSKKKSINLRRIFLPIFTAAIIIIVYFYTSEWSGSISTGFINDAQFSLQFNIPLLLFVFFSFLAGPYQGGITGFLGEFLYQLVYYEFIHIEWCIIVALLGILSGLYKYKPLKYKNRLKILYTFLILFISSTIISFLIIIFKLLLASSLTLQSILIDFGLNFFVQAQVTIVYIVPILLIIYDRGFANKEKFIYNIALTHHPITQSDHTFYFKFGRTYIFFCSRCSGVIIGGLIMSFIFDIVEKVFSYTISPELAVIFCIFLPIPGMIDWGTQTLGFRKSTTKSRLFTGFIIGSALYMLTFTQEYYLFMIILIIIYFSIVGLLMFIGNKRKIEKENNNKNNFYEGKLDA